MDNFTQLANKILTEHTLILKENQLRSLDVFFSDEEQPHIEDNEMRAIDIEKSLSALAATAGTGAKGFAAGIMGTKPQEAKKALDKRAKTVAVAIPAYNKKTEEIEAALRDLKTI